MNKLEQFCALQAEAQRVFSGYFDGTVPFKEAYRTYKRNLPQMEALLREMKAEEGKDAFTTPSRSARRTSWTLDYSDSRIHLVREKLVKPRRERIAMTAEHHYWVKLASIWAGVIIVFIIAVALVMLKG